MRPTWVLLDDHVLVIGEERAEAKVHGGEGYETIGCWTGELMIEEEAPIGGTSEKAAAIRLLGKQPAAGGPSVHGEGYGLSWPDDLMVEDEAPAAGGPPDYLHRMAQTVRHIARIADFPELSSFALALSARECTISSTFVEASNKNLVLFATYSFETTCSPEEYYLIYNALRNSLTIILKPPTRKPGSDTYQFQYKIGNVGVVILQNGDEGSYVLADLFVSVEDMSKAILWLWKSNVDRTEWVHEVVDRPTTSSFYVDQTFSLLDSYACWVDLLQGILVYDVHLSVTKLRFIPLPEKYIKIDEEAGRGYPQEVRSMAVVGGSIKFVSLDGYESSKVDSTITTWTLDLKEGTWKTGDRVDLENLWQNVTIRAKGLEMFKPMCPILSEDEDDMVYLFVNKRLCALNPVQMSEMQPRDAFQYLIHINMKCGELHVSELPDSGFLDEPCLRISHFCDFHYNRNNKTFLNSTGRARQRKANKDSQDFCHGFSRNKRTLRMSASIEVLLEEAKIVVVLREKILYFVVMILAR